MSNTQQPVLGQYQLPDIITVSGSIHYTSPNFPAESAPLGYDRQVTGESQQPYRRTYISPTKWTVLDCGWITGVGLIVIQCSPQAKLPIRYGPSTGPIAQIRPGESALIDPGEGNAPIYLSGDGSNMTVWVFGK